MRAMADPYAHLYHARDTAIRMVTHSLAMDANGVADEIEGEPHPDLVACMLAHTYARAVESLGGGMQMWRQLLLKIAQADADAQSGGAK